MVDEFLTVAEIAELLKVNAQTVRNWIDRHELAAVRVGARRVRVRRSDLDRFLAASEAPDPTAAELESLAKLLASAGHGDVRERMSALQALASAAEALAARLDASLAANTGKPDDARR